MSRRRLSSAHAGRAPASLLPARSFAVDAVLLVAFKLAVGAWVLRHGFTHVSDDDYARTVIAEQFARWPRLDPSGTSWLPLPFWVEGAAMMLFGRSLATARVVAVALGALAPVAPYAALRALAVRRTPALLATAIAAALPWNAWLGAATVPEGWAGALVAAAAIASPVPSARPWGAAALVVASLSRYEAWPACAVMVAVCALCAAGALRRGAWAAAGAGAACAALAAAGPIAWLAWNHHAHGDALHFVARVTAFRRAIGAADIPLRDKVLAYPRLLALECPDALALVAVGAIGMADRRVLRARWGLPFVFAASILVFLVTGDARDGAPTHHAARALAPIWWIAAGAGVDVMAAALSRMTAPTTDLRAWATKSATAAALVVAVAWGALLPARWAAAPGETDAERRDAQIARGLELRARDVRRVVVTPCAFEHFAVLAAWGAPERADVRPRTGRPVTAACPLIRPAAGPAPDDLRP